MSSTTTTSNSPSRPLITARVAFGGAIHGASPLGGVLPADASAPLQLQLDDGRIVGEHEVVWLPPVEVGTVIALGLNYADHVKELARELSDRSAATAAKKPEEPLVFLKAASAVIGHRGFTRRPADASFMHYECELAVVIGRTARQVSRADALSHVAGYSICNDYAVRDYLENWYRPNLR
ncbi:MAG: hypothetical protein RLZZ584_4147, partial [Pseudomonadota bacterium]